jgi:hypothetical protein
MVLFYFFELVLNGMSSLPVVGFLFGGLHAFYHSGIGFDFHTTWILGDRQGAGSPHNAKTAELFKLSGNILAGRGFEQAPHTAKP